VDKKALIEKVLEKLRGEVRKMSEVLELKHREINDAPGAMQSHSDTTKFQASAVAAEQASSLRERTDALHQVEFFFSGGVSDHQTVGLGAILEVVEGGKSVTRYIVLPAAGGEEVDFDGQPYLITTPDAPLISKLSGKGKGAIENIFSRNRTRTIEIMNVW